ncbi:hypothetical protein AAF712_010912 [Marasmius tenuissimus]|uniref:Uncharacterized protein n=1 Tax=Marasmius tenuissimus TaxID=585030 RepID=A0ABR2ZLP6_9AGAR
MEAEDNAKPASERIRDALAAFHWENGRARAIGDDLIAAIGRSEQIAQELDESYGWKVIFRDMDSDCSAHPSEIQTSDDGVVLSEIDPSRSPSPHGRYSDPEMDALIANLSIEDMGILGSGPSSQSEIPNIISSIPVSPKPVQRPATNQSPQTTRTQPQVEAEGTPTCIKSTSSLSPPLSQFFPGSSGETKKKKKKKAGGYLLLNGKNGFCGVVEEWYGLEGASNLSKGAPGVFYRQYNTLHEAEEAYKACEASGLTRYLTEISFSRKWFVVRIENTGGVCKRNDLVNTIGYQNLAIITPENIKVAPTEKDACRLLEELLV